jgi:beta-barrel assembly-enhancing protease
LVKHKIAPMRTIFLFFLLFHLLFPGISFAYDPYSNAELDSMGKQFIDEINRSPQVMRIPLALNYINQLGRRLTDSIHMQPATFFIVNSKEMNAFAGPGGYIGIHSTLILATANEDELAAVMAHELAHVKLHHLYDMIEHEKLMRYPTAASMLAAIALGIINPALGTGAMAAALSGAAQHSINYTRYHEKQADRIGMQMLIKAGFNPLAMSSFFKKLQQQTRYYDHDNIPAILRTHPLDQERIAEAEDRLPKNTPKTYVYSLDYLLFKTLIRDASIKQPKILLEYYAKKRHPHDPQNQYGMALALIEANRFQEALHHLEPLVKEMPNQAFYTTALAQAQMGTNQPKQAVETLQQLHEKNPKQYFTTLSYAQTLLDAGQIPQAVTLLTKAFRQAPRDLTLCKMLAEAEAKNHRQAYAYFIESQCNHLQGQDKLAIQRLKTAYTLAKKDTYLKARIEAKLEEISFLADIKVKP